MCTAFAYDGKRASEVLRHRRFHATESECRLEGVIVLVLARSGAFHVDMLSNHEPRWCPSNRLRLGTCRCIANLSSGVLQQARY
ncbi:hypothetical protein HBI73_176260 [Parastagonospora nodorum]|nr:hypothetical protein HBH51_192150 [Parastagonospora nodorum]KAH4114653.1 hypothetical protein HBH47_192000 [Parastagonospora nodorum]KAH4201628.1 hypothetical protein HBH42_032560 [Parastagonospora nodorum]KAH5077105.1 hypothetical protein HBI73_176260 [Parastagonospora nodorum]KAH5486568.1 hypothetical protein HBI29_220350 [Parastagonospora nodorum]